MNEKIDLQKIADELDFDLEDITLILEVFLEGAKENLNLLKNAIERDDLEAIFKAAHGIKGGAANLTLNKIVEISKYIESSARNSEYIDYEKSYKSLKILIEDIEV